MIGDAPDVEIKTDAAPYEIEAELGRLEIVPMVVNVDGVTVFNSTADVLPELNLGERLRSGCFSDLSLHLASIIPSYRKESDMLNRLRWQDDCDTIKLRTLSDYIEREGGKIAGFIEEKAYAILAENGFDPQSGTPIDAESVGKPMICPEFREIPTEDVRAAIDSYNEGKEPCRQIDIAQIDERFVADEYTVNISIDDVGVVEQKETGRSKDSPPKEHRHYAKNTVIHIQQGLGRYILNGLGISKMTTILAALLLHNDLFANKCLLFFADGADDIKSAIKNAFGWRPFRIILDWYHLKKKCQERLSLAMKGRNLRNDVLAEVLALLWLGKVDDAVDYLRGIADNKVKSGKDIERLIAYFERNRENIPCYALRKQLNLRISSNRGEKANDLVVANRQKHNGMSWSKSGSSGLASVTALYLNKENENWIGRREIAFTLKVPPESKAAA